MSRMHLLLTVLFVATAFRPATASPEVREKFRELADGVLKVTNGQPVAVGVFSQTSLRDTNAGPGLEQMLAFELNRLKPGIVRDDAKYEIKGDYAFAKSRDPAHEGLKVVKINIRVIDKEFAEELITFRPQVVLDHTRTVAEVLQITAALPPKGSKEQRNEKLDEHQNHPSVHVHGSGRTLVSSSPESPYAVEVLVKPLKDHDKQDAQPRPARNENGKAFVHVEQDELYEVRLYNNSDKPTAVTLSVDGLDVFHFSQDRNAERAPRFTHHILQPRTSQTIVGWHNSLEGTQNYLSFLVTAYGQGAVSKAGIKARGQVGVIHVQFSHCSPLAPGQRARSGNETGFGPPREVKQKVVAYEIEPPHDFVSIRYTRP